MTVELFAEQWRALVRRESERGGVPYDGHLDSIQDEHIVTVAGGAIGCCNDDELTHAVAKSESIDDFLAYFGHCCAA